jgi:serine/tyrosine/threonine adenylyltransferase
MESKGVIMTNTGWNFNNSYKNLPESFYTSQHLNPVTSPKLVILNETLAESLGLEVQELHSEENISVFAGNAVPEGAWPLAQAYAGHQFGHFTMLGDGRAFLIGEQITPSGDRLDIQLKGSGRTRYSRGGDGRAALGPMLREYIISEAMHALGIPTTRSLAVVTTGEEIIRETMLPGAILTRVAASHIRVGTFEYALRFTSIHELRALAEYTIERHYPEIEMDEGRYLSLLKEVIKRQAKLISQWQLVGFIHGVMNTDNMTISGETIDYGPCAFMDDYDRATVFSSIDREGRYAFGNQPYIGLWNLTRFAESLLPLLHDEEEQAIKLAEEALTTFKDLYQGAWLAGMRAKLGLFTEEEEDEGLITDLLGLMETNHADYTNTFRALTLGQLEKLDLAAVPEFSDWHEKWQARLGRQPQTKVEVTDLMRGSNPAVIPRNHRVEEALEAAVEGDFNVMKRLLEVLSKPYAHTPEQEEYTTLPDTSCGPYRTFCGT